MTLREALMMESAAIMPTTGPANGETLALAVLDIAHLERMTFGDHSLEREVLELFERQAGMLIERMRRADPKAMAASAHVLKGSARGIGAWTIARVAQALELAAASSSREATDAAFEALTEKVAEARKAIARRLRAN
jgi:HPt (histidine-containing phosphotransfer) domain-containing protein